MKKFLMLLPLIGCFACESSSEQANTPRQEIIELLTLAGEQRQVLYGHQDDTAYGHTWKYEASRSDTKELTEGGQEGLTVENWWSDVLMDVVGEYPISYILTWRNAWDKPQHFYSSYKGHPLESDFLIFTTYLQQFFFQT